MRQTVWVGLLGLSLLTPGPAAAQWMPPFGDPFFGPGPMFFDPFAFGPVPYGYFAPPVVVVRPVYFVEVPEVRVVRARYTPPPTTEGWTPPPTRPAVPAPFTPGDSTPLPQPQPVPQSEGVETGLLVRDVGTGPAASAGLKVNDLILGINNQRTQTLADSRRVMAGAAGPVTVDVIDAATGKIERKTIPAVGNTLGIVVEEVPVPNRPQP